jgi:hypothetical protein
VKGKAIDFGCGIGELLTKLPEGSIGYDINESTVSYCKKNNLPVFLYKPDLDNYEFIEIEPGIYKTFILSHILEHLEDPVKTLKTILKSCYRIGIERVIIVVPGKKGFAHDNTHKYFINHKFFENNYLNNSFNYFISIKKYFPINIYWIGAFFKYHELIVIYDKRN